MEDIFILTTLTKKLNLLVIEKKNSITSQYFSYLDSIFNEIEISENSITAVELLKKSSYDILFLDFSSFEKENPFTFLKKVNELNPKIKIIGFSKNQESRDVLIKCIENRVLGYIELKDTKSDYHILKRSLINCIGSKLLESSKRYIQSSSFEINDCLNYLIKNEFVDVELINHYKGIPIIRNSTVVAIDKNTLTLKAEPIQIRTLKISNHAAISSLHLGAEIFTNVLEIDIKNSLVKLEYKNFIDSYVHHRKVPRVEPRTDSEVLIEHNSKCSKHQILNISLDHILCKVNSIVSDYKVNSMFKIHINCHIDKKISNKQNYIIETQAKVVEIFNTEDGIKMLLNYSLNRFDSLILDRYISSRTKDLILELKGFIK